MWNSWPSGRSYIERGRNRCPHKGLEGVELSVSFIAIACQSVLALSKGECRKTFVWRLTYFGGSDTNYVYCRWYCGVVAAVAVPGQEQEANPCECSMGVLEKV